jgi:hypothetical protein
MEPRGWPQPPKKKKLEKHTLYLDAEKMPGKKKSNLVFSTNSAGQPIHNEEPIFY